MKPWYEKSSPAMPASPTSYPGPILSKALFLLAAKLHLAEGGVVYTYTYTYTPATSNWFQDGTTKQELVMPFRSSVLAAQTRPSRTSTPATMANKTTTDTRKHPNQKENARKE
jgi:hypothetical protein